jgi:pyruvate dehydrogenase E2 component (dihydrolipoamide acetyltransferase)
MLPLIIGFDHRIIDGADAARFINFIIETLQNPEKMLMVV